MKVVERLNSDWVIFNDKLIKLITINVIKILNYKLKINKERKNTASIL